MRQLPWYRDPDVWPWAFGLGIGLSWAAANILLHTLWMRRVWDSML